MAKKERHKERQDDRGGMKKEIRRKKDRKKIHQQTWRRGNQIMGYFLEGRKKGE